MLDLPLLDFSLLLVAAAIVGISKTALPGAGTIAVAVFAAVLPARQSTGALLVLLMLADLFAVWTYHAHADWRVLRRMVPTVLVGVGVGTWFLAVAGDGVVKVVIGGILLALVAVTLVRRRVAARHAARVAIAQVTAVIGAAGVAGASGAAAVGGIVDESGAEAAPVAGRSGLRRIETPVYGVLAGFTTMVANAGGPVMSLYLLATRLSVQQFLGTAAWFFFIVNLAKTPFSISLGLISADSLRLDLLLAPAVVLGALLGQRVARRLDQDLFERLVLVLTIISAVYLLVP